MDEFDVLEWLLSGKPVPFTIDGVEFALRQPAPLEVDRMRYQQTRAHDKALADYHADGLGNAPVSHEMIEAIREYNEEKDAEYKKAQDAGDTEAATRIAREQEQQARQWPTTLAEERAHEYRTRVTRRYIVENFLEGDKDAWRLLTAPEPLARLEVIIAVGKLLNLINHDPNLNRRMQ